MPQWRETLNSKPWIGWAFAGVMLVVCAWVLLRQFTSGTDTYDPARMTEFVTVMYTDTGETEEIPRGRLIKMLLDQGGGKIDPTKGIINPKTKQPTGFLYNKAEWESLVKQLNDDRE